MNTRKFSALLLGLFLSSTLLGNMSDNASWQEQKEPEKKVQDKNNGQENSFEEAIIMGAEYLIDKQSSSGSWGKDATALNRAGHGVGAITALGLLAMKTNDKSLKTLEGYSEAIENAQTYLIDSLKIKKGFAQTFDIRHWNNAFALLVLTRLYREKPTDDLKEQIEYLIEALDSGQDRAGGWSYMRGGKEKPDEDKEEDKKSEEKQEEKKEEKKENDSNVKPQATSGMTFLTATCLLALLEAKDAGFKVPQSAFDVGVKFLLKMRQSNGNFGYMSNKTNCAGKAGSCSRNVPCELVLYLLGEGDQEQLQKAVGQFFAQRHHLEKTRKQGAKKNNQITHAGKELIAPYYYFFSHFWTSQALYFIDPKALLDVGYRYDDEGDGKTPADCFQILKDEIVQIQKSDGKWIDSGWSNYEYGTAMALIILSGNKILSVTSTVPVEKVPNK